MSLIINIVDGKERFEVSINFSPKIIWDIPLVTNGLALVSTLVRASADSSFLIYYRTEIDMKE